MLCARQRHAVCIAYAPREYEQPSVCCPRPLKRETQPNVRRGEKKLGGHQRDPVAWIKIVARRKTRCRPRRPPELVFRSVKIRVEVCAAAEQNASFIDGRYALWEFFSYSGSTRILCRRHLGS
jgi:hypothetical protein